MSRRTLGLLGIVACLVAWTPRAWATWSICLADKETKEVAIGSATCLVGFNLQQGLPVVRIGEGVGAAQSYIDTSGQNRRLIWDELAAGTSPEEILMLLRAQDSQHPTRQYGIVDTLGRAATFSGQRNGDYKNGVTGQIGNIVYSIQGNVITGQTVIDWAEQAVINTPGDMAEKLMAGMEAARAAGGDGRCSCSNDAPESCGSPPPEFDKAAHVGFMIVARAGDRQAGCKPNTGCANGDYWLELNVIGNANDPDPVFTLRDQFDAWRATLDGLPDAVQSEITLDDDYVFSDGTSVVSMTIQILDWQGNPAAGVQGITVDHDPKRSAGSSTISTPVDLGGGMYEVTLGVSTTPGLDVIRVTVTHDAGETTLMPGGVLHVQDARGDFNHDGIVDLLDLEVLLGSYGVDTGGDFDGDGNTDLTDLGYFLGNSGF